MLRRHVGLDETTIRFLITGSGAAALFYGLTFAFVRAGAPPFAGTLAAYGIAFVVSYTVQHAWTFAGQHAHAQSLPRYVTAQLCSALLAAAISRGCGALHCPTSVMALASTVIASAWSFVLSRYWVFAGPVPGDRRSAPG